ncbi:MAG: N-formylglutamate amidohydrolase [Alphaproteobacteria bacterium]|nr:N-formylglutamate amidohydrolase [Alphaproteobacteria bacterium]
MTGDTGREDNAPAALSEGLQRTPAPFIFKRAQSPSPFLFAVPHSGRIYPDRMRALSDLSDLDLRISEDAYVDKLFEGLTAVGGDLLIATHARAYLDLNRAADELDPSMFTPPLEENTVSETHRVRAGLGLIPRIVAEGMPIYNAPLAAREAFARLDAVYYPYHQKLMDTLAAKRKQFGCAVLIDCHSMPSDVKPRRRSHTGPDIVLGDNWGSAGARDLTSIMEELLIRSGFRVRRNVPYSGGYTTQHYGKPNQGFHALQVEICRSIYMDEETLEPLETFGDIQDRFQHVCTQLMKRLPALLSARYQDDLPKAAE